MTSDTLCYIINIIEECPFKQGGSGKTGASSNLIKRGEIKMNNQKKNLKPSTTNVLVIPEGVSTNQNPRKRKKKRERLREREYDPS